MHKTTKWLVILICSYYIVSNCIKPISFSEDTSVAVMCLKNILHHGSFNTIAQPNSNNLAHDIEIFVSTWSPAHYLIPYLFVKTGMSIGHSYFAVTILCLIIGLIGYYKLLKTLNISNSIIWITLLLIITNRSNFNTNFYNLGMGEMMAFASLPWYILFCFIEYKNMFIHILILCVITFLMIMIKNSLLIACAATICFFAYKQLKNKKYIYSGSYIIPLIIAYSIFKFTYQTHGTDASKIKGGIYKHTKYENAFIASAAPIASIINLSDIEDDAIPGKIRSIYFQYKPYIYIGISLLVLLFLIYNQHNLNLQRDLLLLFLSFYTIYTIAYLYFSINENWMDYTFRHFRFYSILFIPILFISLNRIIQNNSFLANTFIILFAVYGLSTFTYKKFIINKDSALSSFNFSYNYFDTEAVNYLRHLDDSLITGNNLFFITTPEAASEIKHNRQMVSLETYSVGVNYKWLSYKYQGKVDNLYVFAENRFFNLPNQQSVLNNLFDDYTLEEIKKTNKVTIYKGKTKN